MEKFPNNQMLPNTTEDSGNNSELTEFIGDSPDNLLRPNYLGFIRSDPLIGELTLKHISEEAESVLDILCRLSTIYPTDKDLGLCIHNFTKFLGSVDGSINNDRISSTNFKAVEILYNEIRRRTRWLKRVVHNNLPFYYIFSLSWHPNRSDVEDAMNLSAMVIDMLSYLKQ